MSYENKINEKMKEKETECFLLVRDKQFKWRIGTIQNGLNLNSLLHSDWII